MSTFESKVIEFLTERRTQGDGWTPIRDIRAMLTPNSGTQISRSLATYVRLVPGVEVRGGWTRGQPLEVRMKEVTS